MSDFVIETADKSDKKAIQRFYKQQRYSARFLGDDVTYLVRDNQDIIASVIISFKDSHPFLHALVVAECWQHQGLATKLLIECQKHCPRLICFCAPELSPFYTKNGFAVVSLIDLPEELQLRFNAYRKNHELVPMIWHHC